MLPKLLQRLVETVQGGRRMTRLSPLRSRLKDLLFDQHAERKTLIRRCAIAAFLLLVTVYADVVFLRASVSSANAINLTIAPAPRRVQLYPERPGREAYHAYFDVAGAAFQSEPGAQFMRRAFWNGDSVFWNPYSGTGSYGIETIVDVKTSPLSMVVALLGGSDFVFHLVFLGFSYLGVFCLLTLLCVEWRLPLLAALAGGVAYLLNGYSVANLAANYAQTWLYFPVLLLALTSFARRPRVLSFLGITAGSILILSTTFLPTTTIILGVTLLVGAASAFASSYSSATGSGPALRLLPKLIVGQLLAVLLALVILSVVYLPVSEALLDMATNEYYAARAFHPAALFNLISLFTPKHAFEAYNAITPRAYGMIGNIAFHQGIVGALVVTQVIRSWSPFHRIIVTAIGSLLLLLLARVYGLPLYSPALNHIPVLGNIGQQYLWIAIGALFTLLIPLGLYGIIRSGVRWVPLTAGALVILGALLYTAYIYGIDNYIGWFYVAIAVCLVIATIALAFALRSSPGAAGPTIMVVLLFFIEMTFYVNSYRLSRTDRFLNPPNFVRFLQLNSGPYRVASYGHWGIPPEYGSAYGIAQIGAMTFHLLPRYVDLFNRLILPEPADRWTGFITLAKARDIDSISLPALTMVGVKYLMVPGPYKRLRAFMTRSDWRQVYEEPYFLIFENPGPLRSYVTRGLIADTLTPLDRDHDPRSVTTSDDPRLIEDARQLGIPDKVLEPSGTGEYVSITRYEHVRVQMVASLSSAGIVVLNDAWHKNWHARVNGRPHYIGVVNQAFRGLALPPGQHIIEMNYAPRTLVVAKILSALGLLIAFSLLAAQKRIDSFFARHMRRRSKGTVTQRRSIGTNAETSTAAS